MNVFITGANGFIGLALCRRLLKAGYVVSGGIRKDYHLPNGVEKCVIGDLGRGADLKAVLHGHDALVHLAGRAHVMHGTSSNPLAEYRKVNVEGTLNLARQAAQAGIHRFVFISSVKVNGESTPRDVAFTEKDVPAPVDAYGISKFEAEQGVRGLSAKTGMEVVIIRPPLIYGPGVKANFLRMMKWLYKGFPLPLGAVHNKRSLVGVDNLIDFIVTCVEHPSAANETFLVSDGKDLSTNELVQRLGQAMGKPARLLPVPDVMLAAALRLMGKKNLADRLCGSLQVDISRARKLLGWQPPITVEQGLRKTAQWFLSAKDKSS